ncbi:hypothetical protein ACTXT7_016014 [Hymenolepis weldensis]
MPQPQTQQAYPYNPNHKPRCRFYDEIILSLITSAKTAIRTNTRRDSARAVNGDHIQATREAPIRLNIANASGDAVQLSGTMKCEANFKGKTVATVCYVADRDISLLGLDWIDMFIVLEPKVQSVTCSTRANKRDYKAICSHFRGHLGKVHTNYRQIISKSKSKLYASTEKDSTH